VLNKNAGSWHGRFHSKRPEQLDTSTVLPEKRKETIKA
jgi:hypothetical protein